MFLISPWAPWVPELGLKIQEVQAPSVKLNSYKRYLEESTLVQWRLSKYLSLVQSGVAWGTSVVKSPEQSSEGPWKPSDPPLLTGEG